MAAGSTNSPTGDVWVPMSVRSIGGPTISAGGPGIPSSAGPGSPRNPGAGALPTTAGGIGEMNLGWYWIPRIHWGPAWVHWYWDHNYVGWCPLSYYDRPVVLVGNRFYDRYRDSYYPIELPRLDHDPQGPTPIARDLPASPDRFPIQRARKDQPPGRAARY